MKHYKMKGSYAVEAAFVVPVVLGLIFAMMYVLYYLHDKNVIYSNMQKATVHVAEGKKEYKSDKEWQEDMQNNLWMFQVKSGEISDNKLYITSKVQAECNLEIPVLNYFLGSKQQIELENKYMAAHPEHMIRIKGILSKK